VGLCAGLPCGRAPSQAESPAVSRRRACLDVLPVAMGRGRRSRGGPTCKKRTEREGWKSKRERSPGGFPQIAIVRFLSNG
jgi:hypothetical protein